MSRIAAYSFLGAAALAVSAPAQGPTPAAPGAEVSRVSAAASAAVARQVAVELKAEDFAALFSRFDEKMKAALPETALRLFWAQTLERAGPMRSCAEPSLRVAGEYMLTFAVCTFEKQKAELRLTIRPDGRIAGMFLVPEAGPPSEWNAPDYVVPSAFVERELSIASGRVTLPATLSMPKGDGPFPGVVLVHGSGPHDRDETVGGARVFQDLAQGLASRGIAVLRYEKRTKTYRRELAGSKTITVRQEVLDDALSALALLRSQPGVDGARVFVLGHSLGAMLAPRIAALDGKTAGLVLLAAPSRPMSEVAADQVAVLTGLNTAAAQDPAASTMLRDSQALTDLYAGKTPVAETIFGAPSAYWLDLKKESDAAFAARPGVPILVLAGGRDFQVGPKDFEGWRRRLAGVRGARFKSYPGLNHLFVPSEGRSNPAEYEKPGHVSREVVEDVAAFVVGASRSGPEGKTP